MTQPCACGFHLNPPNTPCKCDGKRPECDKLKEEKLHTYIPQSVTASGKIVCRCRCGHVKVL